MARNRLLGFDAFLSYANKDEALARAVQLGLQRFGKPWYRLQALRVFRDKSVLTPGPGLWESLEQRLETSRWMVLLASPEAAQSAWVQREVQWWRDHHSVGPMVTKILIVHTAGRLRWEGDSIDWSATDALPRAPLDGTFSGEPLLAALPRRDSTESAYLELLPESLGRLVPRIRRRFRRRQHSDDPVAAATLRRCIEDVAAAVHEVPKDLMVGEHRRQHRRTRATVAVTALAVIALLAGLVVVVGQATDRQRLAAAAELVRQAAVARDANPALALRMGITAHHLHPNSGTRAGLVDTLTSTRYRGVLDEPAVAFAPGGSLAATVGVRTVTLWDVGASARPQRLATMAPPEGRWPATVAFAPDGRVLATADSFGEVALHDVTDPVHPTRLGVAPTARRQDPGSVIPAEVSIAFTPGGTGMAIGTGDASPTFWDVRDRTHPVPVGEPLAGHTAGVPVVAISPDGRTLATGDASGTTLLWDLTAPDRPRRGEWTLSGHTNDVTSLAFSPTGVLAVSSLDGTTLLWDVTPGSAPRNLSTPAGHTAGVSSVAFSPTAPLMATGGIDGRTVLWNIADPTNPAQVGLPLGGRTEAVRVVAFTADGRTVASSGDEGTTILWTTDDPAQPRLAGEPFLTGDSALSPVALDPSGRVVATGAANRSAGLVDVSGPARPRHVGPPLTEDGETVSSLSFAPVGHTLAVAGSTVVLWETSEPAAPRRLGALPDHETAGFVVGPARITFSSDGRLLACAYDDGKGQLWDVSDPAAPRAVGPPIEGKVSELAFSPDGKTLAVGSYTGTTALQDITDPAHPAPLGEPLAGHPEHRGFIVSLAFSSDGSLLATGSGSETVIIWDVHDRTRPTRVGPPLDAAAAAESLDVAFTPVGNLLVTSATDGAVVVRDVTDPDAPVRLGQPLGTDPLEAGSFAVSADGRTLVVGSWNGWTDLVDLGALLDLRAEAQQRTCEITGRGLDRAEWERYLPEIGYEDACRG